MELALFFDEDDEYSADCEYLFPEINQNTQLESLFVRIDGFYRDRFEDDFTTFASHLREMTKLKELTIFHMVHFNEQAFSEELSENKKLEFLHLDFQCCTNIADEGISNIIASLASHPKLEKFHIGTEDQFGELSSKALQKLLSKTQTLSTLDLYNEGNKRRLNAGSIVQGLKKNQSLKTLKLCGDLTLSRFFHILPHCPKLENLELSMNDITKNDLERVSQMDRLQKPIILEINDDDDDSFYVCDDTSVMTKLLRCHPEVRLKVEDYCFF